MPDTTLNLTRRRFNGQLALLPLLSASPALLRAADNDHSPQDPLLATMVNNPQRNPANRARDAARHPYETLHFFGLSPDLTVIEIAPGGGWYTEILAPYLRQKGSFYTAQYAVDDPDPNLRQARTRFDQKLAGNPAMYGRVQVGAMPSATHGFIDINPPGGADMVLTFRNIHNWLEEGYLDASFKAFYNVLKPGGVLGIEEHRAPAGTPLAKINATGYVPEELVIAHAQAAGFRLAAKSEINANPKDTKDYPNGVWSLPPTLAGKDVDREKFLAIGESDRMTMRFVKP